MKFSRFFCGKVLLLAALVLSACHPVVVAPEPGSKLGFAMSFIKAVADDLPEKDNFVVSPYSAGVALSMLEEGAGGQTKVELDNALNGCLFRKEDLSGGDSVKVVSANSIWVDDDFSIRNSYLFRMNKDYGALVEDLSFADPATLKAINNWCSENTEGKIKEILDKLSPSMVMVLANALYFNAPWQEAFDSSMTHEAVFKGYQGECQGKFMSQKATLEYAEYQGCQLVSLPYQGGRYSMYILLPPSGISLSSLMPHLSAQTVNSALGMLKPQRVHLTMPKLRLEGGMNLNPVLEKMGVVTAFSSAADFKGIAEMGPLVLDQVKQKCYIDIAEKGTEAAAVTVAQMRLTSVRPDLCIEMNVNRPYMFFIADIQNSNVLFAGRITKL